MPVDFQVTVDCDDPHAQARFWAEALGYTLEVDTAFVRRMVDEGRATQDDVVEIDGELFWAPLSGIRHPDTVGDLSAARRSGNRLLFQHVPDRTPGKNSWHLDLNVGEDAVEGEVARLTALGAVERGRFDEHGSRWVVLEDPEGNRFCVQ